MFEHAIYSVISPEAASSILWRDGTKAQEAATSMKITAQDMLRFGVIDQILKESAGGAHRDPAAMISARAMLSPRPSTTLRNLDADGIPPAAAAEIPRYRPQARLIRCRPFPCRRFG